MLEKQLDELFPEMTLNKNSRVRKNGYEMPALWSGSR